MYELLVRMFAFLHIPEIFAAIIWPVFPFVAVAAVMVLIVLFLVLLERRFLALLTVRKGPNRVGPNGFFQTIADAIKLLTKEDIMSEKTDKFLFTLAPIVFFFPVMVVYGLIPFNQALLAINIPTGLFSILAVSSVSTLGIVLAGWASNNKYSLLGSLRAASQSISYEIPLVISALSVVVLAGSMNLQEIVAAQSKTAGLFNWFVWPSFVGLVVFFICTLAEINRIPFDLPEAESELVSGFNTEYSGMKFALFFLAEYAALFIFSVLISVLFFGGYASPFGSYLSSLILPAFTDNEFVKTVFVLTEQVFWLLFKAYLVIFFIMWVRATLPRIRADKLSEFCWKFLMPIALLNLLFVTMYRFYVPLN